MPPRGMLGNCRRMWLKHIGACVVGTTSSDTKAIAVRAAGADAVINYGHNYSFVDELLSLTNGQGVDLAFDGVGAGTLMATLDGLARGGTVVSYGQASGPAPAVDPLLLTNRFIRLAGGSVFIYTDNPDDLQSRAAAVIEAIQAGWLEIGNGFAYSLDQVAQAHLDIENRKKVGKLYLKCYK